MSFGSPISFLRNIGIAGRRDIVDVSEDEPFPMGMTADVRPAKLVSATVTLSAVAGQVRAIEVPDFARGFKLYPTGAPCQFTQNTAGDAAGLDPEASAIIAAGTTKVAQTSFKRGGIAKKDQWETRLLAVGTNREVRLISAQANLVVEVEFF